MSSGQQKPDRSCLSLVGLLVFVIAVVIVLLVLWLPTEPPERLLSSVNSPDGVYTASKSSVDLGATGGNAYIRIRRASESSSAGEIVAYDTTASNLAGVSWADNRTLVVGVYDAADQLITHDTAWHGVRVVYKKRSPPSE